MDKAQALLDAHVAFLAGRTEGEALQQDVENLIDSFLGDIGQLKLKDLVTEKSIQQTVKKYAVELQLGGAMPALVGDIARALYDHKTHSKTRLEDLIPDRMFTEFLDKILELEELRASLVALSVSNPIFSQMISELLYNTLRDYAEQGTKVAERVPGAKSAFKLGKAVMNRARPDMGEVLEENLRVYVKKSTEASMKASERFLHEAFEADEFRELILDLWADNKHHTVASIRDYAGAIDVEEIFVILYEYWHHLRETRFFTELVNGGIHTFFACYGNSTVAEILDDIGVTREMMIDDAMRFAPKVIATLKRKKMLEPMIRLGLEDFYASPEAQAILKT